MSAGQPREQDSIANCLLSVGSFLAVSEKEFGRGENSVFASINNILCSIYFQGFDIPHSQQFKKTANKNFGNHFSG